MLWKYLNLTAEDDSIHTRWISKSSGRFLTLKQSLPDVRYETLHDFISDMARAVGER